MSDGLAIARQRIADEAEMKTGSLDLGGLALAELPAELYELDHLQTLRLGSGVEWWGEDESQRNRFELLPAGLARLERLASLSIAHANLKDLAGAEALSDLRVLDVSANPLSGLAPVRRLTALQSLDCSNTQVSDLSPLRSLAALQSLACWNTQVSDLSPLQSLAALQSLNCRATQVNDLSPLQSLAALQSLKCSHTQVSDLSPLQSLAALQSLTCSHTQVSDLSPLQSLAALQSLTCSRTQVSDLSPLQSLAALQSLDCWGTQVSDLSPLQSLAALQSLDCSDTQVSDLSLLQSLAALQSLACSRTQVSDLSPLQSLAALQSLYCSDTQVSDLSLLQSLAALQSLNCSGTRVSDLSPLQSLAALQSLACSHTQVSDLSPLQSLAALQSLACSHTQVSDLSPLLDCANLRELDAAGCELVDLPRRLLFSTTLQTLRLHGAALPGVPAEVLTPVELYEGCLAALRAHVLDADAGTEPIRESKLVVLGNGRVGKTQLSRRLRGLPYDDSVPTTHGISVSSEPWVGSDDGEALNLWDFGGQDIYHGAHTLFMKTSAVFLIAWHPDFETDGPNPGPYERNYPLPYWLDYVRTLGRRDSPLIVVQTRCETAMQEVKRLPVDDAQLDFASLKPCWYSAKTQRGQGALADALGDAIQFLRDRDGIVTIGVGRARVIRQVQAWRREDQALAAADRQHRTLSVNEFEALCRHVGDVHSPAQLLEYLHHLGVVFFDARLFDSRIILDQSWALDAVYAVFDRDKAHPLIVSQRGRFTRALLAMTAWRNHGEDEQRLFLGLMQSCGIAFVHREADARLGLDTEYLAPDLLPERTAVADQLAGRWNEAEPTWRLAYDYPFLHAGLVRALVCDVGERSKDSAVYWKQGLWVYDQGSGARAMIEQQMTDERRGRLLLRVQGPRHAALSQWLRERIEARNRLFGHPQLQPTLDELPREAGNEGHRVAGMLAPLTLHATATLRAPAQAGGDPASSNAGERAPAFARPPAESYPPREPEVFISYAWGDETPEGQRRGWLVDQLCAALRGDGRVLRRDRDEMQPGQLISNFMDRLIEADLIIAVISDKYLRSEYCMYELFSIYRQCADRPERFLRKVIPLILPDARIDTLTERLRRARHWTEQKAALEPEMRLSIDSVGPVAFRKYRLLGEFAHNTSDMLEHLIDKLQPRDFEAQARDGFQALLKQIRDLGRPNASSG